MTGVLAWAKRLRPTARRWQRLLDSFDLEIGDREFEPVGEGDFIVCGLPRSGTSLMSAALYQPPSCITVMEPWDGLRMPPAELMRSLRDELRAGTLTRGRLDVATLLDTGRVRWGRDGEHPHVVEATDDSALGVKWPTYWQYLGHLPSARFLVCVRNPIEVINSFARTGGRLAQGFEYDVAFNRSLNDSLMNATDDPGIRRAILYEMVAATIAAHAADPNVLVIRYEQWFEDPDQLMQDIAVFLDVELGPGHVRVRRPMAHDQDPVSARLVEDHCPSAVLLGYETSHV